jgi:hypothetical protein
MKNCHHWNFEVSSFGQPKFLKYLWKFEVLHVYESRKKKIIPQKKLKWMNNGWSNLTIQSVSRKKERKKLCFSSSWGKQEGKTVWPFEKSKGFPLFPSIKYHIYYICSLLSFSFFYRGIKGRLIYFLIK